MQSFRRSWVIVRFIEADGTAGHREPIFPLLNAMPNSSTSLPSGDLLAEENFMKIKRLPKAQRDLDHQITRERTNMTLRILFAEEIGALMLLNGGPVVIPGIHNEPSWFPVLGSSTV